MERTDEELIGEIKKGNILAFEEIVRRYQNKLFAYVSHIVYNRTDAEEIIQDTFLKVYNKIKSVDTGQKFSSYIFAIARNTAISYLRTRKKDISLEKVVLADEEEDIYENLADSENRRTVICALNKLSRIQSNALKEYYFNDLSYKEIARKLQTPINTVRTNLKRGRENLKRIMNDEL